jgi:hypothetical protein
MRFEAGLQTRNKNTQSWTSSVLAFVKCLSKRQELALSRSRLAQSFRLHTLQHVPSD